MTERAAPPPERTAATWVAVEHLLRDRDVVAIYLEPSFVRVRHESGLWTAGTTILEALVNYDHVITRALEQLEHRKGEGHHG